MAFTSAGTAALIQCEIRLRCHRCALERTHPHTNRLLKSCRATSTHQGRWLNVCTSKWVHYTTLKHRYFHSSLSKSASHRPRGSREHFSRAPQQSVGHPSRHPDDRKGDNMAAVSLKPCFVQWSVELSSESAMALRKGQSQCEPH